MVARVVNHEAFIDTGDSDSKHSRKEGVISEPDTFWQDLSHVSRCLLSVLRFLKLNLDRHFSFYITTAAYIGFCQLMMWFLPIGGWRRMIFA